MIKRIVSAAAITLSLFLASQSNAQVQQDPTPEQQAIIDQMQTMTNQIQQNIQNSGIDPQAFAQQIQQQMQSGNFDPAALQQQLVDQGIMTQDMVNQFQSGARTLTLSSIRQQLGSTDEEWAVIEAKIQRVVTALSDVDASPTSRMAGRILGNQKGNSPMQAARVELQTALADPNVADDRLSVVLMHWRTAHQKAKIELATAQSELINILTLRQEAVLLGMGVL